MLPPERIDLALTTNGASLAADQVLDPDSAPALDEHSGGQGTGDQVEVGPVQCRAEVGVGCRPAATALLIDLEDADAVLLRPVEVVVALDPVGHRRLDEGVVELVDVARVLDPERPAGTVVVGRAAGVVLGAFEVREDVGVAPAGAAVGVAPRVVVEAVAPDVEHRVDRGRAPQHLAAWPLHAPALDVLLLHGRKGPVVLAPEEAGKRGGDLDLVDPAVVAAGLEEQHAALRVL